MQLAAGLDTTQTALFALFKPDPDAQAGSIDVPEKGIILKPVPVDGKWEALVKPPNISTGYWRNDALTRQAFNEEGFSCLGDALRFAETDDVSIGFFVDGQVADNLRLPTRTWVGVGA